MNPPSRDNLQSRIDVEAQSFSTTLAAALEYHSPDKLSIKGGFSGAIGQVRGSFLDLGMGYDILQSKDIALRLGGVMSFGSARIGLGDIQNNSVYIQVNNAKFYSDQVSVDLSPRISLFRPEFTFVSQKGRTHFMASLGYQLPMSKKKAVLLFDGKDEADKQASASESINADNVYLELDGARIRESFIDHSGPVVNIGLIFTLK